MTKNKSIFCDKNDQLPSLDQLRTMILCEATERYLAWRNNKNVPDKRGFLITFFTWSRHYTSFGEQRAKQLKHNLRSSPENWFETLKKHFSEYNSINNHSLDTYLLEAIWQTEALFSISAKLLHVRTKETRKNLMDSILEMKTISSPEAMESLLPCIVTYLFSESRLAHKEALSDYFILCDLYELHEDKDDELCFDAFALMAEAGFKNALPYLERMAEFGSMTQQSRLSHIYEQSFKDEKKAVFWEKRTEKTMELGLI